MREKSKLLFLTSRPLSWINTAYPFAAGYLCVVGAVDVTWVVATLFFFIPYNLLMYGINDVFDYESDMQNPRKGGIEGAVTPQSYHRLIITTALGLSVPFVVFLLLVGSLVANIVLCVLLFFVVAYSAKYLRFKEIPFLDSITSSIHFVGPLVYALAFAGFPHAVGPYVSAFFLWGVASQAFGAVQDVIPDRVAGIRSIATVLGARTTVYVATILYLFASLLLVIQGNMSIIVGGCGIIYALSTMQFLQITDSTSARARVGWKRFLWLNYAVGAVVTIVLIVTRIR